MVGRSEHSQIEARLDGFLTNVEALQLDLENLRAKVQKPLRPEWITQSSLSLDAQDDADYHRVVCCTASRQEGDIGVGDDGYVQGAGDDSELWSKGLTPAVFWQNRASLLSISHNDEDQIISLVQSPKSNEAPLTSSLVPTAIVTPNGKSTVSIGSIEAARTYKNGDFDVIITCDILLSMPVPGTEQKEQKPVLLQMKCQTSKLGSRTLRDQLPRIKPIIDKAQSSTPDPRILFACASGRDLSVGMGLTVLCLYFDDNGIFMPEATTKSITKDYIRRRLSWIMASKFDANPARATLQSVNAFLMERKPK
ncbi:hypothetical protein MMC19_006879 [Ptychographa xylographoides]|nr:hypothetical protein [Ptychographa xylographoides]